jgi:hypothetical protein
MELEMIWKEVVVLYFKVLAEYLPEVTEKYHENF